MAGTATPNSRHNVSYNIAAAQHYGLKIQCGVYTPTNGTTVYTSVGDSLAIPGISTPLMVAFGLPGATGALSTRVTMYLWDATNKTVRWFFTATGGPTECSTTATSSGLTAPYIAVGY